MFPARVARLDLRTSGRDAVTTQNIRGNKNVQIQNVQDSSISITIDGETREVPLEPAIVPVATSARSPARLVRARSGVVPYAARKDLLGELQAWLGVPDPFAVCVIGGRGGTGKTRLAVELCKLASAGDWLSGLLSRNADQSALETLVRAPTARLVVADYAESRAEQLEVLLPLLAARATAGHPVRVLLLVRASPLRTTDWTERLRGRGDMLDAVLDECACHVLEDLPLTLAERETLFAAAAHAFASRRDPPLGTPDLPDALDRPDFSSPLLVVTAAYLAVHAESALPATRAALLDELLMHERRYWRTSAADLFSDDVLPGRIVGLATLGGAGSEADAAAMLRLLPDLADATAERRMSLARWAHDLYTGPSWWNPLEPDLLGERLVATAFTDQPLVLTGVLTLDDPTATIRPLEIYARAAADDPDLAAALQPILSRELRRLCEFAVTQAVTETDRDLIYGKGTTIAAAIDRAVGTIE